MRVVHVEAGPPYRLTVPPTTFDPEKYLAKVGSGLAAVRFRAWIAGPPPGEGEDGGTYSAGQWIRKQADRWGIKPQWILMVLQTEQGLVRNPATIDPHYTIGRGSSWFGLKPATPGAGCRMVKSKDGPVEACGDWKMMAAGGAGIPDPGVVPPWNVASYLGFDKQVYWIGRMAARDIGKFRQGERDVLLYPSAEEKAKAAAEGRKPRGEIVQAGDIETFVLMKWTPNPDSLITRPAVYKGLFRPDEA